MISCEVEHILKRLREESQEENILPFFDRNPLGVHNSNNDAIIVFMMIAKHDTRKILGDSGSSNDVLFYDAFVQMNLPLNHLNLFLYP